MEVDLNEVIKILRQERRKRNLVIEYQDEDGEWWEVFGDESINRIVKYPLRIVKKQ